MGFIAIKLGKTIATAVGAFDHVAVGTVANLTKDGAGVQRLFEHLDNVHARYPLDTIYVDAPRGECATTEAAREQLGFYSAEAGIPVESVPAGTYKKAFTGNGSASRGDLLDEAYRRGFGLEDEASAEALAIFHSAFAPDEAEALYR